MTEINNIGTVVGSIENNNGIINGELTENSLMEGSVSAPNVIRADIANDHIPGIMKLYSEAGTNTDGTMTQKAISENFPECIDSEDLLNLLT